MSELIFTRAYAPLTAEDIADFEARTGVFLPPKYRAFLLRQNGGHPNKAVIPDCCVVQYLCAITDKRKETSLEHTIDTVGLSEEFIPIGYGGVGYLCLSLATDKIYILETAVAQAVNFPPGIAQMTLIAPDIDAFLDRLVGNKPRVEDEELSNLGRWGDVQRLDEFLAKGRDINELSEAGESIVSAAICDEDIDFLKACVLRGASLKNQSLLHWASFLMNAEIIAFLLAHGVDPNEHDPEGRTPLDWAPKMACGLSVQLLRQAGGKSTGKSWP